MKPFDLEAAKRGEPICTRGGVERLFIGTNQRGEIFVEDISGKHYVMFNDGMTHTGKPDTLDLFMAEPRRPQWQQDLIDAVKAGKVVEVDIAGENEWSESSFNLNPDGYVFGTISEDRYRIRPEKVTRYLWAFKYPTSQWRLQSSVFMSDEEAKSEFSDCETQRLDWSATEFEE